jgi:hypothetical protein
VDGAWGVLTETQLVLGLDDAPKRRRTSYHVAEPVLGFHRLVGWSSRPMKGDSSGQALVLLDIGIHACVGLDREGL